MTANKILATVALLAAFGTVQAQRVLEQPEAGYELTLEQLTLPSTASGGVTMKRCESCAYSTHVLTAATQFHVNGRALPYVEFKQIVDELRDDRVAPEAAAASLFIDVDTGRVTRVALWHNAR